MCVHSTVKKKLKCIFESVIKAQVPNEDKTSSRGYIARDLFRVCT